MSSKTRSEDGPRFRVACAACKVSYAVQGPCPVRCDACGSDRISVVFTPRQFDVVLLQNGFARAWQERCYAGRTNLREA